MKTFEFIIEPQNKIIRVPFSVYLNSDCVKDSVLYEIFNEKFYTVGTRITDDIFLEAVNTDFDEITIEGFVEVLMENVIDVDYYGQFAENFWCYPQLEDFMSKQVKPYILTTLFSNNYKEYYTPGIFEWGDRVEDVTE